MSENPDIQTEKPQYSREQMLGFKVEELKRALNRQTERAHAFNRARRKNWHRAEAAEAYSKRLALQVDEAAELISNIVGDCCDALEESGRLHQAQRLYDQLWRGNHLRDEAPDDV